jgi:hypothetical protein
MDTLERDSRIIRAILEHYARIPYAHGKLHQELVFDLERHRYVLMVVGWLNDRRVHYALMHVDVVGDKIWIQYDGTEEGIPRERIVLGFHPEWKRPITGYAVA